MIMTNLEMVNKVKAIYEANEDNYTFIGLRFENKERSLNEICECSKNNVDREDEREFPEFGTEEYENSPSWGGASAWDLSGECEEALQYNSRKENINKEIFYEQEHCYIIAGDYDCNADDGLDDNEIVIEDAKVIAIIF